MIIYNEEQRSKEWHIRRLGKVTGSRAKKVFATNNLPLIDTLIAEVMTGEEEEIFTNAAMQRGIDEEPHACSDYEKKMGYTVDHVGICIHDTYDFLAVSPDGWVDNYKGAVEIKCPKSSTHIRYIRQGSVPSEYKYQVMQYFLVNEDLQWLDFVSYDPRVVAYPLFTDRVWRKDIEDDLDFAMSEMIKFNKKYQKYLQKFEA